MAKKPVMLCIMDGFGWTPNETYGNAVAAAKKPFLDSLMAKYPMTTIEASGMAVGLPDGQMGNSEVGHTNMGAGRIVYQQLTLITKSIKDGEMLQNPVLVKNMKAAIDAGKAIHLMGLVGTGGVHSHADHWFGVLEMAKHLGAKNVYLHCITDGRDTDPHSGKGFLADLQAKLDEYGMRSDVTRIEFADTEQIAFLYQDRISVLLGTLNDLDYKLDRARYVLTNADGKGCAPTDTGRLDFSHVSAGSTRKIYFAQGQPTLPSGYVVPEKTVPEEPDTSAAEDTAADGAEDAAAAQPADDTAAAAEETPLTDPARMTANNEENPM